MSLNLKNLAVMYSVIAQNRAATTRWMGTARIFSIAAIYRGDSTSTCTLTMFHSIPVVSPSRHSLDSLPTNQGHLDLNFQPYRDSTGRLTRLLRGAHGGIHVIVGSCGKWHTKNTHALDPGMSPPILHIWFFLFVES